MNDSKESDGRMRGFIAWGIIGLLVLIGISIIMPFLFTTPISSGVHLPLAFFPFQFGFIGIIFLIFMISLISRWIFWSNSCGNSSRYHSQYGGDYEVQNIVKERYAKGAITKEQFEQIKKDLEQK
ncbi:MAG: SHOCT domain-containing protein [Candidatus Nitrosocosmicus sp.]|nr:SHOCT domain-containing protein [Candidatus Nitrosocosmicus sp.]MDN5867809.1 SHOCT domain-containing protein [Candidatus Nitrosocosmicus sp.]